MKSQRKKEDGGDVEVEPSHIDPIRSAQAPPVLDPMRSDAIRRDPKRLHWIASENVQSEGRRADGRMWRCVVSYGRAERTVVCALRTRRF